MKKHLAWILVLCMVFSLLPISALAADPAASYVVFHDEDGNVIDSVASPAKAIDYVPAVSGQKMLGWTQTQGSADVDFAVGADVAAAADVALYPVVDSNVAVVRFVGNDDEASYTSTQYVEKGGKAVVPADPSAPGLAFAGWFADEDCTVPFDFDAPVADDVAVYAGWDKVEVPFTVIVWMQKVTDSASASDAEKTYDFGCSFELKGAWAEDVAFGAVNAMLADVDLANLAVEGFHFNSAKTDAKVTTDRHGSAILNVFYDRDVIKYVFTPNAGPSTTLVGLYGADVAWPDGIWKYRNNQAGEHYTFRPYEDGFVVPFDNAGGNVVNFYNPRSLVNEKYLSVTYELQQLDGSYAVDKTDKLGLSHNDVYYGNPDYFFTNLYNGYDVVFYTVDASGEQVPVQVNDKINPYSMGISKLFVYYNLKDFELHYFLNGGSMAESAKEVVKYTTPLAGYDRVPVREGFVFGGWFADPTLTVPFDFAGSTMPAANVAVFAKWVPASVHVKAIVGEDVVLPDGQPTDFYVPYGEGFGGDSFDAAVRPGFDLDGWAVSDAAGEAGDPFQFGIALDKDTAGVVAEGGELVLYITPEWVPNPDTYTVSYDPNGGVGEIVDTNAYLKDANAIVTSEEPTAPAGYQFEGWATTPDAAEAELTARELTDEIQGDLTLYAVYCPIQLPYVIEYYYDEVKDDSATETGVADFGSTVQYPDKAKDGFMFEYADPESLVIDLDPAKNVQKVFYVTDNWNDEEDDPDKPDGIPDKYQVLVKDVADENGEVTGRELEIITLVDAEGNYVKSGDIVTSGSEATPAEDYKLDNWTDPAGNTSADGVFAIPGVAGGSTVVITAHFVKQAEQKLVKVWDDKDDIDQIRPESVKVDIKQGDEVVKADVELTAENDWTYVWYGDGEWTVEEKDVAEGYTAEVAKGEDGSYVLTNTHVVIPELEKEDHFGYIIGRQVGDKVLILPEENVTRAEVVTVFFRLLTEESRDKFWSSTNDFSDVPEKSWFNNAVSTMVRAGVINGYPDGSFKPNAPITRAELATIAVRFFELQKSDKNIFSDTEGHWAVAFINAAVENNLITGYPDGTFQPNKNIIRAEFITVVNRMIERKPDKNHLLPKDQMINWDDNPEGTWYYEQIQEATNSHEYEWITVMDEQGEGVVIEKWTKPLPMRDWVQLEKEWSDAHSGGNPGDVIAP